LRSGHLAWLDLIISMAEKAAGPCRSPVFP
jgi:hypothetical protein